jgi:hypothetical protein
MIVNPQTIKRTNRKSLSLIISPAGDLVVRAPKKMDYGEIFEFIQKKEKWISEKQLQIKGQIAQNTKLINYEVILFLGKRYQVAQVDGLNDPYLTDESLFIKSTNTISKKKRIILNWFLDNVENILVKRIIELSKKMQLSFNSVKIINSKQKWGMCDQQKNLYFNWKLLTLAPKLIDYVIIHELSHLLELNHSKDFWNIVKSILPNYETSKKLLKDCSFITRLL